jgi:type II secretory pathway pseudopilin PulG
VTAPAAQSLHKGPAHRKDSGYTLLLVIFLVATMLIFGAVATQSVLTEGRREREEEMIWRGQQYERAISLYYRKFGRYPTKIDDLVKATNGVRYLREAYTDPTNKTDGTWRFIYIGANGQLTGSNLAAICTRI